jgi:mutator protein MutT
MVICVGAVVLQDHCILLIRQAPGHSLAGQWSIPWGIVDNGETPEDAVLRETLEESGITAMVSGLLGIQNLSTQDWLGIIFLCQHIAGAPAPDGVETDKAAYFSLTDLDAFSEPIEPWCEWLVRRVLAGQYTIIPAQHDNPYKPRSAFL